MGGARTDGGVDVSVIIPALEATPHVLNLVRLLAAQEQAFTFEILLVLNHAPRETGVELPPCARLLFCETPGSFAARNAGIAEARGNVLAFLDGDVMPEKTWMQEGHEAAWALGFRAMIAGAVTAYHERRTPVSIYEAAFYYRQDKYVERGFASPINFWVPRAAIETIGNFDESLFAASGVDFSRRAAAAGIGLAFAKDAIVYHPMRTGFFDLMRRERRAAGALANMARVGRGEGWATSPGIGEESALFGWRWRYLRTHYSGREALALKAIAVSSLIVRTVERLRVAAGKKPMVH